MAKPRWPNPTINHVKACGERFKKDIESIAEILARHEKAELVLFRHADEAFEALGRLRFNRRPFYKRPELEVGSGVSLWGIAAASPGFFSGLFPGDTWRYRESVVVGIMVACIAIGIGLVIHGWIRGTSP
jgi:hypothetical protein